MPFVEPQLLAELLYESSMYKLYHIRERHEEMDRLQYVKDLWNSIDVPEPKKKKRKPSKPKNDVEVANVERFT